MKKIIIILWAMLFSFCTWAQGSERLRDHQIPAKLEGFFKYADSLGYWANVHYIQRETRKVSVSFSHFVRKDENVALLLDSARHTFHTLADEAQETFFWESHKDGVDSVEYALHLDKGNLKFTYNPSSLVYLDFMYQVDSIKHPITEKIDKRGYWKMLKEVLKRKGVSKQKFYIYNDSTHIIPREDQFVGGSHSQNPNIEHRGIIYTIASKELADELKQEILQETWSYIDKHPNTMFTINPDVTQGEIVVFLSAEGQKYRIQEMFTLALRNNRDTYQIVACDFNGDQYLPADLTGLKSYKNGKKVYHKNQEPAPVPPKTSATPATNTSKSSEGKKKITFTPVFNHVK